MSTQPQPGQRPPARWSCVLIGDNALTAQCAQILLDRGHRIEAFVTGDPELGAWAARRDLRRLRPGPGLERDLRQVPADYLFSIANLRILPPGLLDLPRLLAVNYHDGPLPRHAGLSATSWAVAGSARGAREHGVTWHVMTAEADAGDILLQQPVPLEPDDTAFTLNAKCFQAALDSFAALVESLAQGTVRPRAQDLNARTYHGLADPPPDGGILYWPRTAAELQALVRAADGGPHQNDWGAARLLGPNGFVLVNAASVVPSAPGGPPGTVTGTGESSLSVAAGDGQLVITGLSRPDGSPVSPGDLARRWDLTPGARLPVPDARLVRQCAARVGAVRPHEAFWARRLGRPVPFELPYRDPDPTAAAGRHDLTVPVPRELSALAPGEPSLAVLAAVLTFLARVGGEEPFDVGLAAEAPFAGTTAASLFAPVVPLRAPGGTEQTFAGLRAALAGELADLARRGPYLRDLSARRPELRYPAPAAPLPLAVVCGDRPLPEALPEHPAVIRISADASVCLWSLDRQSFGSEAARALADDFAGFLAELTRAPGADLGALPLLTKSRRRQVLTEWNDTAVSLPGLACVTDIIEREVRRRPGRVAVADGERELTYRELADRAGRVTRELTSRGVGPGSLVGVLLRRRADLVSVLLGILAAGAAYVPLDPVYPRRRLEYMIADAGLALLVADPGPAASVSCAVPLLDPGPVLDGTAPPGGRPGNRGLATLDDPAYVIYTSGSTGRPKGVMVGHRALSNLLLSVAERLGCGPGDRMLAVTTVCFDIAGLELLLPLTVGGQVQVAPQDAVADGFALRALAERCTPNMMQGTPATWRMLLAAGWPGDPGLRALCGGEALPAELAARLGDRVAELWNMYGPTETTIWSAMARVRSGEPVTIGRPLANTRLYVLDRHRRPVPPFVPGELYIAGDGVADGYLGRPELTAQRFVPEGFRPDGTMYRTGDIVRYLDGGELQYLHRADSQVKVRGYRVELGEIEAVMARHPAVDRCVATVRDDGAGDPWIAAYVVSRGAPAAADTAGLRRHAAAELPSYMVPGVFVALDQVPLTDNGKVDRNALPAPARARSGGSGLAPRTDLEQRIARAWRVALPTGDFGLDDNFFEAGGGSLTVVSVVAGLREQGFPALTVVDMFRFPTVRTLAAHLGGQPVPAGPAGTGAAPDRAFLRRRQARLTQ